MQPESPYTPPPAPMPGDFIADKVIGIIMIIFATCGLFAGIMIMAGGGMLGSLIASEAAKQPNVSASDAQAAAGLFGLGFAFLGGLILVASIVSIINGIGIYKGAKWGFILGIVLNGINVLLNMSAGPVGFFSAAINIALLIYCVLRLTGNLGPRPL